jgi:hypothetical protein
MFRPRPVQPRRDGRRRDLGRGTFGVLGYRRAVAHPTDAAQGQYGCRPPGAARCCAVMPIDNPQWRTPPPSHPVIEKGCSRGRTRTSAYSASRPDSHPASFFLNAFPSPRSPIGHESRETRSPGPNPGPPPPAKPPSPAPGSARTSAPSPAWRSLGSAARRAGRR